MMTYLLVALGGALGSIARFWCSSILTRRWDNSFPVGTLFVNVSGSFIIGFIAALSSPHGRWPWSSDARAFIMIGILGGYTTFSSFSLQTLELARNGKWAFAALNIFLSILLCLGGVWLGQFSASLLNPGKGP